MAQSEPHIAKMHRLASRLGSPADKEDIVQDALLDAWRNRAQYDPSRGTYSAWLMAITAHRATRGRRRFRRLLYDESAGESPLSPERVDVELALAKLSDRQRLAVNCHYFVGLNAEETASVMGCSIGTVKSTLFDARQRLRTLLSEARHAGR
jgi:RNA polymerase sigma-70 factor (ECF subfamily)